MGCPFFDFFQTIGKDKKNIETNLKVSETPVAKGVAVSK